MSDRATELIVIAYISVAMPSLSNTLCCPHFTVFISRYLPIRLSLLSLARNWFARLHHKKCRKIIVKEKGKWWEIGDRGGTVEALLGAGLAYRFSQIQISNLFYYVTLERRWKLPPKAMHVLSFWPIGRGEKLGPRFKKLVIRSKTILDIGIRHKLCRSNECE